MKKYHVNKAIHAGGATFNPGQVTTCEEIAAAMVKSGQLQEITADQAQKMEAEIAADKKRQAEIDKAAKARREDNLAKPDQGKAQDKPAPAGK